MNLLNRRFKTFAKDAVERAIQSFATGVLGSGFVIEGATLDVFGNGQVWSVGLAAAVVSLLASLAARKIGSPNSASVL